MNLFYKKSPGMLKPSQEICKSHWLDLLTSLDFIWFVCYEEIITGQEPYNIWLGCQNRQSKVLHLQVVVTLLFSDRSNLFQKINPQASEFNEYMNILLICVQKMVGDVLQSALSKKSASLHTDFLINWILLRNHTIATYRFFVFYLNIIHHLVFVFSSSWRILYEWTLIRCFWKSKLKRLNI